MHLVSCHAPPAAVATTSRLLCSHRALRRQLPHAVIAHDAFKTSMTWRASRKTARAIGASSTSAVTASAIPTHAAAVQRAGTPVTTAVSDGQCDGSLVEGRSCTRARTRHRAGAVILHERLHVSPCPRAEGDADVSIWQPPVIDMNHRARSVTARRRSTIRVRSVSPLVQASLQKGPCQDLPTSKCESARSSGVAGSASAASASMRR